MQNRNNKKFSPRLSPSGGSRKKFNDVSTNTSVDFVCEKCAEREQFDYTESEAFRASYLKSINYINCCHSLMNELLYRKTGRYTAKLPDMPNFMDVLAVLQAEDAGGGGSTRGGLIERGVVTDGRQQCDKSCGDEKATGKPTHQDYREVQSDVSEEDMDRYAQELLLTSSNGNNVPRYQCFQVQTTKPSQCCSQPEKQHKRHPHLTNLNLLKQLHENNNNEDENSDTDYIPSDDECDSSSPKQKQLPPPIQETSKPTISHPLKLNQRSLHLLDENALNKIGLFNENGELQMDAIKILEAERHYRAKDARNKQFRRRRASSDTKAFEKRKLAAVADDLSDIKSESELEMGNNADCGVIKVISGFKGGSRKS